VLHRGRPLVLDLGRNLHARFPLTGCRVPRRAFRV
jgi:hypothetical protein